MSTTGIPSRGFAVEHTALTAWVHRVVCAIGTPTDIAADVADVLVAADLRGAYSHGTFRLPVYVRLAQAHVIDQAARPAVIGGGSVLKLWDAKNGWGAHAGRVLIDDAIDRACDLGMAASISRHASHFGIAGWYAMRASARGLIGLAMSNTSPLMAPTRGRDRLLGTNPIALSAPSASYGPFVLDMATSAITWGRVLIAHRRGSFLPASLGLDAEGHPTRDPRRILDGGALSSLGGGEDTAGYKGYGLSMMVDILTGVLAGAHFGSRVVPFSTALGPSDLGQLFIAIDPSTIDDAFTRRMDELLGELRSARRAPGASDRVVTPGEPEEEREAIQRRIGIILDPLDHAALVELGDRIGIPLPGAQMYENIPDGR